MVIPEERVPADHPLHHLEGLANSALNELDADFSGLCSGLDRDSIPPEKLLRAQLLMTFYMIRSERQLMEQIDYNLLFRWFAGSAMHENVCHSVFS
jgi:transposase